MIEDYRGFLIVGISKGIYEIFLTNNRESYLDESTTLWGAKMTIDKWYRLYPGLSAESVWKERKLRDLVDNLGGKEEDID